MFLEEAYTFDKKAMAFGPRSIQEGNFAAGSKKFRLVDITEDENPQLAEIKNRINETYSADGGQLYFLFAAENRYSSPMDVNDSRTLEKMMDERQIRQDFVECVYLRNIDEFSRKENDLALKISGIIEPLAKIIVAENAEPDISETERNNYFNSIYRELEEMGIFMAESYYKNSQTEHLFEQFYTDDKRKANPIRFALNTEKMRERGLVFRGENKGIKVYETYSLYTKSANYHKEVMDRGEIELLDESITKLKKLHNQNEQYDVNSYISDKISGIKDEELRKYMEWTWAIVKRLHLPLQYPSWVAISWPQGDTRKYNFPGSNYGENKEIENIEDLTFVDEETGRKKTMIRNEMVVPAKSEGTHLPVTPHSTLMEIIGKKPSSSGNQKSVEYLKAKIRASLMASMKMKGKDKGKKYKEAEYLKRILTYYEMIRDNMNSIDHRDKKSFFYLYDEICNLFFSYNRERYGDGIMLANSASIDAGENYRIISASQNDVNGRPSRPFIPLTLHDDLREVVISVHYAYGSDIPQFASTALPGNTSMFMDEKMMEKMVEKASEKGLKKLTIENQELSEKEIPIDELPDFFKKMANGKVLVFRIKPTINPETNEKLSNIVWYTGMKSFGDRYDEKVKTTRMVYDESKGLVPITGYGTSRISSGNAAISASFASKLAEMRSAKQSSGVISTDEWKDAYVGDSLLSVFSYANEKWGLDYDYNKIYEMSAKKIKSISPEIFKEMSVSSENSVRKEIAKREKEATITITESTQDLVREIISEIAREDLQKIDQPSQVEIVERKTEQKGNTDIQGQETQTVIPVAQPEKIIPTGNYTPSGYDKAEYENLKSTKDFVGRVSIKENQVGYFMNKGYVVEQIPETRLYRIVQFPQWTQEEKYKV